MPLSIVATPIGNLGDLSPRSAEALTSADLWLVEDTRVSGKLQGHLGIKKQMKVLNEHTSPSKLNEYVELLTAGSNVALLTDGGTPVVSDPGTQLVDACMDLGIPVDAIPGPSAPINALALSGFFGQRFAFLGFLGRKPGAIKEELGVFADSPLTLVLFESPHRFNKVLELAGEVLGSRRYTICREMTKVHQQIWRRRLPELPTIEEIPSKGEFTIVIEGKRRRELADNQM